MKDIQSQLDHRRVNIKKVGVKTISYPITVKDKQKSYQSSIASVNMYVNLPHKFKGTHMSRFVEILNDFRGEIDVRSFHIILEKMKSRLEAEASHLELEFLYFLQKEKKPKSLPLVHYKCAMHGSLEDEDDLELSVEVPISLPLTKGSDNATSEISLPGSMGSWGKAEVALKLHQFFWIEDIIVLVEEEIEKEIQVRLHQKDTLSVELLARRVGKLIESLDAIRWFKVTIHNFGDECSTFATVESC